MKKSIFSGPRSVDTGTSIPQDTPYRRAAQVWDERIGSARVQARNWRLQAFGGYALAALFAVGFMVEASRSHWRVVVVPVDQYGKPGRLQLATETYEPPTAYKASYLAHWVQNLFTVPMDRVVLHKNLKDAFASLVGPGRNTATAWIRDNDPDKQQPTFARTVEVTSVLQKSPETFQVDWIERTFDNGTPTGEQRFTGLFGTKIIPPKNEAQALVDPMGIYISSISWTRG